ncbi:maleylpyruvate isomerase family mycothiol-dependent enzyme [Streptomyces sp. UNOB3_S3]|uniref:maleylpyruvate isomerase family mycothiol-dependent enzyme n=1 Tax=Streptomyces sp. UNOB3_S3 TaxID=2871682 RepID=UPI001E368825|nr:maleylpyruvate isomerase family mycothiol-dependent enzyme [Streptomyces sp. UNOB3_S3]MCC3778259.1 maleylpyruvate isomerase family mycothiol-dependent enzyme [Streptomyces sp. UNOB3_S3]
MTLLSHERYCQEILTQTELMRATLRGVAVGTVVPTCPDWTVAQLGRHLGNAHRFAAGLVRERTVDFTPDISGDSTAGAETLDAAGLDAWLAEGAEEVVAALREAGPDVPVWTFGRQQKSSFWARRMTHETVMHRADAASAAGVPFTVEQDVAADTLDEWLDIVTSPLAQAWKPQLKEVLGDGRTLHLHATDTPPELNAEWFVDATGESIEWRRAHEKAAVAVQGPLTEVLRVFYRRLPADTGLVEVVGDRAVLEHWLERVSF